MLKLGLKLPRLSAILPKTNNQNSRSAKINNNKLRLNIVRVSAILPKFRNGSGDKLSRGFVYIQQPWQVKVRFKHTARVLHIAENSK